DILICRAPDLLDGETRKKLALFTNMDPAAVFTSRNIDTTMYELPLVFFDQKLDEVVLRKLCLEPGPADLGPWKSMMARFAERKGIVRIALVGKYMELDDAYKSVFEALFHAGLACGVEVRVIKVNSEEVEAGSAEVAALFAEGGDSQLDGVLIPGGFGDRGIAGIVRTAGWARRNKVPCFGVCLGMQLMVIEWCRNVIGWKDADSGEFSKDTTHPVISLLEELRGVTDYGGTMRLGSGESVALPGTLIHAAYSRSASGTAGPDGKVSLWERHRHRYEFSNRFRQEMVDSGLIIAALTPDGTLVESVQWPDHPWGVGVQFHPEFKSKPTAAAPLFRDFIAAAKERMLGRPDAKAE
ncbi:MAG: CTP synthase, partial [Treponema sp.]|nr:CTP synthase [Treponema sp.]